MADAVDRRIVASVRFFVDVADVGVEEVAGAFDEWVLLAWRRRCGGLVGFAVGLPFEDGL